MAEKIYCGSGRIITGKFGDIIKISLHKDDVNKIVSHMKGEKSDWINLEMKEKKDPVEGKPTHYLQVDTWKPDANKTSVPHPAEKMNSQEDSDGFPF